MAPGDENSSNFLLIILLVVVDGFFVFRLSLDIVDVLPIVSNSGSEENYEEVRFLISKVR